MKNNLLEELNKVGIQKEEKEITPEIEEIKTKLNNEIEEMLKPSKDDGRISATDILLMQMAEANNRKMELINKFASDGVQKTEITTGERKLLPILYILASEPFPTLTKEHPELKEQFELSVLADYLEKYIMFGIPLKRKGRKEEVEILKALVLDGQELEFNKDGSYMPKKVTE